jgi:hypothetical protein
MECYSIDESGYTGFDLLNPDQRFQGATALSIDPEEAKRLIREHFPKLQASELKYSALARRPGNRPRLLALQRDVLSGHKCVTMICDKRFLLILMFLDYAAEPFYYERGIDFYENGQNYSLASLLYYTGPTLLGKAEFDATLAAFQKAVKNKTPIALEELVSATRRTKWTELPEALGPLANASPACLAAISTPGVTTDAAYVVLQGLISRMEVMASGPYRVEHDRSDNLLNYHALLERFIAHHEPAEFKQTQITSLRFPLKLVAVTQVDSKQSPSVQLADVMIGAAIEAAKAMMASPEGGTAAQEVFEQYADEQFIHIVPSLDFEEERRFRQGSQGGQFIDYVAEHLAK